MNWHLLSQLLGLLLLILGAKFWLLRFCGTSLPIFDQWEGEGGTLLQPWLHGKLHLSDLFAPWGQHRIVWTRLLVLGLFQLNGQWDSQVGSIAGAGVHALVAVMLGAILIRRVAPADAGFILFGLLLLFALPFASENTLIGGFSSQYYFYFLFSVVAIWGLGSHQPGSAWWWTGVSGAFCASFAMATGGFAALAVAAWAGARLLLRRDEPRRETWLELGTALLLGIGGLSLNLGVPQSNGFWARSAGAFAEKFVGFLGWPNPTAWAAPLAFAPFIWLLVQTLRPGGRIGPAEKFLVPLGLLTLLQAAALAYARNQYRGLEVSRYTDFLSLGTVVNFSCALLLTARARDPGSSRRRLVRTVVLLVVWVAVAGFGLCRLTSRNIARDLAALQTDASSENRTIAAFIARPDPGYLLGKDSSETAAEDPVRLVALLQDVEIRRILPAAARAPIVLESSLASPFIRRVDGGGLLSGLVWVLAPRLDGRPVHFRSQTLGGSHFPYLRFPMMSMLDDKSCVVLVDERSDEIIPLQQDLSRAQWQSSLVKTPTGPYHVEAALAGGARRPLAFYDPREVGWLSAWVDTILDASMWFLFAGAGIWLGAAYWQKSGRRLDGIG